MTYTDYKDQQLDIAKSGMKVCLALASFCELSREESNSIDIINQNAFNSYVDPDETIKKTFNPYYDLFTDNREDNRLDNAMEYYYQTEEV